MPSLAPVIVFAYMRAAHLRLTIESLLANPEAPATHLHIYCDGAKHPQHQAAVDEVRDYVESVRGFASITRVYRSENKGLAASVIAGVTEMLQAHDRVIVLEDDLVLSRYFLQYMNDALACYERDPQVSSIHGYCWPTKDALPETFFLEGADCWGWATWARAWAHFEPDGRRLLAELQARRLTHRFDLDGAQPFSRMLEGQIAGKHDSWAIRWHASCFVKGLLTLYPGRSLVNNIGNDSSGTHCNTTDDFSQTVAREPVHIERMALEPSAAARQSFSRFFRWQRSPLTRARNLLDRLTTRNK